MRLKCRNVSKDSPFDARNLPPQQYLQEELILKKPGQLDIASIDASKIPLAGRLSDIGQKILTLGGKEALFITTGPW